MVSSYGRDGELAENHPDLSCSGCLGIQGGLLLLEQTVGPNKPKQIE